MLNNGQKVFVPDYGAGIMIDVKDDKKYDIDKEYKSIIMLLNNINLYIPKNKLPDYKIRKIESEDNLNRALQVIKDEPSNIEKKWSKRYRINNEKIRSGSLIKICEVLRDLYYLKRKNIMPLGERKILIKAENMLASEIVLILNIELEKALTKIRTLGK